MYTFIRKKIQLKIKPSSTFTYILIKSVRTRKCSINRKGKNIFIFFAHNFLRFTHNIAHIKLKVWGGGIYEYE